MLRDGNHFIRIYDKWVLIDGPWFELLKRVRNGAREVRIPEYPSPQYDVFPARYIPKLELLVMVWRPIEWWSPTSGDLLQYIRNTRWEDVVFRARVKTGWVCEDGIIPAEFNRRGERRPMP